MYLKFGEKMPKKIFEKNSEMYLENTAEKALSLF